MEKPYREAGGPAEGMVNMEANRGASPRGLRAVSPVCTLETPKSALWRRYYLNSTQNPHPDLTRPCAPLAASRTVRRGSLSKHCEVCMVMAAAKTVKKKFV